MWSNRSGAALRCKSPRLLALFASVLQPLAAASAANNQPPPSTFFLQDDSARTDAPSPQRRDPSRRGGEVESQNTPSHPR